MLPATLDHQKNFQREQEVYRDVRDLKTCWSITARIREDNQEAGQTMEEGCGISCG